jgi:hypothetical protein
VRVTLRGLGVLALLVATPAAAQDAAPAWAGVWQGRIGTYPVRVCLDSWGDDVPGRGSYYYLSQLEPISLTDAGDGMWIERASGSDNEAEWFIEQITGKVMRGMWRQGARTLRFELNPLTWSEGDGGEACGSPEFLAPRLSTPRFRSDPAERDGLTYSRRTFIPPAHWREDVSVDSFLFQPEHPGDEAIVEFLRAQLPTGRVEDEFVQCLAGAISSLGTDGFYEHTLQPSMVSRAFLAIEESLGTFCGGAHPNHFTVTHTYDRQSGAVVDLFDWLGDQPSDGGPSPLPDALRELILSRWPSDMEEDCREVVTHGDYWSLGLAREGLAFTPDLPHAFAACEEAVTVEWPALAPFLDEDGRAGLARLRAR